MENIPAFGSYNPGQASSNLQGDVSNLAPLATHYSGAQSGVDIGYTPPKSTGPQGIGKVFSFFGAVGKDIGHLSEAAAGWAGRQLGSMAIAPIHLGEGLSRSLVLDDIDLNSIDTQNKEFSDKLDNLHDQFKSGIISADEYKKQLNQYNKEINDLSHQASTLNSAIGADYEQTKKASVDTALDLVTILTGGFGKAAATSATGIPLEAKTAGEVIGGQALKPFMQPVEDLVNKFASNPLAMKKLTTQAAIHIQQATAEVIATGERMTAGQIARASVANLALKYPITYGMFEPSAQQFYSELDNKKYGDAVQTLAYNSAIILAGGTLGYAFKETGKVAGGISARTFGKTQFFDELSKYYQGNFRQAASELAAGMKAGDREEFIKNLSAWEATSVHATGGDVVAAARRVSDGQMYQYGFNTSEMEAKDEIMRAVNHMKWQREVDEWGKLNGKQATVGRVDARNLNDISASVSPGASKDDRLQAWEAWKSRNPQLAAANSSSLDQQIKGIIARHEDAASLDQAIRNIKAQFELKGFPSTKAAQMAKDGYIAIKPVDLEAPFREGSGVLKSASATGADFWMKAVKPVPILSHLGSMLTAAGLSPNASTQRVYQVFNDYFAKNLSESGLADLKIAGESEHQASDTIIKQLSNYIHNQTRSGLLNRTPITDLRQMTVKDIMTATGKTESEAKLIERAIAVAHVQVPLAIKGLGEKMVDALYWSRPTALTTRRYLRLQGALRFAINPFFQYLRVIPKNEILSEAKGGGYINSIFAGRLGELKTTRTELRKSGFFSTAPGSLGNVVSGEATDATGTGIIYTTKKLLPTQEKSIAGLVDAQARKLGMTSEEYIKAYPDKVGDTIQSIVAYSKQSNFLNSPLARTLNIAIFPFRFDTKVVMALSHKLADSGLLTRVAFMKGLFDAHDFLTSPEGKAWYQQNAEVIGLMKYITPIGSLNEVFNSLLPGKDHSIGNFGELGGLPFGWIPQILDAEGLTHFNQPGADPKTGAIYKDYIPVTARGQLATAIQDFLSSLFSYPGATVGLPSKTSITLGASRFLTESKQSDFNAVTPQASAEQKAYQTAIGSNPQQPPAFNAAPVNPVNIPTLPTRANQPLPRNGSASGTRKKKADFRPSLLPGQTVLGAAPGQ